MAGNDKSMLMKDIMNDILAAAGTEVSIIPVVQGDGILIGQFAAISLDGDLHRVVLLFRFGVSEI